MLVLIAIALQSHHHRQVLAKINGLKAMEKARRAMRGSCMGRYMGRCTGDARGEPHLIDEVDHAEAEEEVHQHEHEHRQRVEVGPRLDHLGLEGAGEDTATAEGKHAWV